MSTTRAPGPRFAPLPDAYTAKPDDAERDVLERWEAEGAFEQVLAARRGAPPFVFWEGPPTANGRPGIHHVLARTLKDVVCRYQTMLGRRVERKAGWDTHGLPVELEVEKALSISGKPQIESFGVAEFNERCRTSVWTYREDWERLSARIGYWLDYAHPYVTYEAPYVDSVWAILARMHASGLVYRGRRVLPFCGRCGTGLSSHELGQPGVYRDLLDPSVTVRFPLVGAAGPEPESFLAWTTTPWTLPSNFALAVHPEREYVRARVALAAGKGEEAGSRGHEIVWVAAERADAVLPKGWIELARRPGRDLFGLRYAPPFEAAVPFAPPGAWEVDARAAHQVVGGEFVTVEDGTGIVHQAPYGADDWETARANRMPLPEAVGREGRFVCDVGPVAAGTFFKDADEALMEDLKARGLLFKKARESHSYPHCWRCDTPLFYFPAPAWYVKTTALKERMLALNARVRWVPPEVGQKRFGEWLENNVDWNISRDRYWGTPLPFWVCSGCNAETALSSLAEVNQRGRLVRDDGSLGAAPDLSDPHKPGIDAVALPCGACGGTLRRTSAVLDCWFDSGAMPFAQHGWPHLPGSRERVREQFPADFICEGLDQTRGWFYTLHAIGTFLSSLPDEGVAGDEPIYRTCLVNGLVLDKDGVKMSKRLGNVIDPWKMVAEHGADAVRWYLVASAAPYLPKRIDPAGVLEVRRRFFSTLANSYQFFREYARLDGFDPQSRDIPAVSTWPAIDRWLLSRTQSVAAEVRRRMQEVDLTGATRAIESFVVDELSNWYIRRNRRRFWKGVTGADKLAAFSALYRALVDCARWVAPFAPFLAEMLWQRLVPGGGSVHAAAFPESDEALLDRELEVGMELVVDLVVMGRSLREKVGQRVRQPLRAMHVRASDPSALRHLADDFASGQILDELNVKGWGSLEADDGALCKLSAKANFKVLGKRLGPRMKAAASAIEGLPPADLARLRAGQAIALELEGGALEVGPEDVLVQVESRAEFPVETNGAFVVWYDTDLDEELIAEGLAREAVNRINGLRKEAGLEVEQRVRLEMASADAVLRASLERHRAFIAAETLASAVEVLGATQSPTEAALGHGEWDLGDGRALRAWIWRA